MSCENYPTISARNFRPSDHRSQLETCIGTHCISTTQASISTYPLDSLRVANKRGTRRFALEIPRRVDTAPRQPGRHKRVMDAVMSQGAQTDSPNLGSFEALQRDAGDHHPDL